MPHPPQDTCAASSREDVDAHGGERGLRLLRLLLELVDRAVRLAVHDAEAGSLGERNIEHRDGRVRAGLLVLAEHLVVVHLVDVVAGQDENIFRIIIRDKRDILINCVRRTLVPLRSLAALIRRQDADAAAQAVEIPRLARADVGVEHVRLVLGQHADRIDAGVDAVGKRKINNAVFAAKRYSRLCNILGQNIQAAALAACQKHSDAFLFTVHFTSPFLPLSV